MSIYRLFNLKVKADINLTDEILPESVKPDYKIYESSISPINKNYIWYHRVYDKKRIWLSFSKHRNNFGIRFHRYADFKINSQSNEIFYYKRENTSLNTLRHLINDQVIPLTLTLSNKTVFHSSTVKIGDYAVSFQAPSGSGKSTIAAYFVSKNHELITDDSLLLGNKNKNIYAYPSYPCFRLWPESLNNLFKNKIKCENVSQFNSKKLISSDMNVIPTSKKPLKLKSIYFLNYFDSTGIVSISQTDSFSNLIKNLYRLDLNNKKTNSIHFEFINKVLKNVELYKLNYEKKYKS
ncbi:MAG: hypothetical protein ACR2NW_00970, partial [Thermodesulfobacteriota bacterium]